MSVAIRVDGLSKRYRLGETTPYSTLRESLADALRLRRRGPSTTDDRVLWALRDVSFEVERGEALGVLGRNGAGKSTLLKVLSRITEPTSGRAELHGRLASLLEVGTGFHPELTGRENVLLNAAILGMSRREVEAKFDAIVAFAEIERFLDTPVKRYSSGMYMRLAFSVAAHLEPEILVIDEVLAVGDLAFQRKCLGKMDEVAHAGRTILLVSHNLAAVRSLCKRALLLDGGQVVAIGEVDEITDRYVKTFAGGGTREDLRRKISELQPDPSFRLHDVAVLQAGLETNVLATHQPIEVRIEYEVLTRTAGLRVYVDLCDESLDILVRSFHDEHDDEPAAPAPGRYVSTVRFPGQLLAPRDYTLVVRATVHGLRYCIGADGVPIPLTVEATSPINRAYPGEPIRGKLQPRLHWETERV